MSLKKIGQGLLFGSLVGGTLGLLFAPRSGNDTRRKLKSDVEEATATTVNLDTSLRNFQQSLNHLKNTAQEILPPVVEDTKEMVKAFQFQAQPRVDQIKEQVEEIQNHITE